MGGNYSILGTVGFQATGLLHFTKRSFIKHSRNWNPADLEVDLTGRVHLVTGANSGLGYVVAKELAKRNGTVIMICRDERRGREALETIQRETGNQNVSLKVVDVGKPSEVTRFTTEFLSSGQRLDVLINNAGALVHERQESEGIEVTFGTHVLGAFLLTENLIPALTKSAPSRVVTVTSGGMYPFKLTADYQNQNGSFDGLAAYGRAKRAQVYLTELWAKKYSSLGITFNTVHPGWARTPGVAKGLPGWFDKLDLRTPEEGADSIVWLAISPSVEKETGKLWFDREEQKTHLRFAGTHSSEEEVNDLYSYCETFLQRP